MYRLAIVAVFLAVVGYGFALPHGSSQRQLEEIRALKLLENMISRDTQSVGDGTGSGSQTEPETSAGQSGRRPSGGTGGGQSGPGTSGGQSGPGTGEVQTGTGTGTSEGQTGTVGGHSGPGTGGHTAENVPDKGGFCMKVAELLGIEMSDHGVAASETTGNHGGGEPTETDAEGQTRREESDPDAASTENESAEKICGNNNVVEMVKDFCGFHKNKNGGETNEANEAGDSGVEVEPPTSSGTSNTAQRELSKLLKRMIQLLEK